MSSNPSNVVPGEVPLPVEFASALVRERTRLGPFAARVVYCPTIGSTNDVAASLAASGPGSEGIVVLAAQQTSGRGRRGRTWFSPAGSGLYVSTILVPGRAARQPARATMLLTIAAGVAMAEGVERAAGLRVDLKWPNDLYVGRRKLGGILAEAAAQIGGTAPHVVLGYGINVHETAYPPDLCDRATSLESETGRRIDPALLLVETLAALAARYRDLVEARFDAILDEWRRSAPAASGGRVSWSSATGPQTGITAGIDGDGALLVDVDGRIERIVAGELTWEHPEPRT